MPKCKGCGAEIIWTKTASGKATPLDAKPKTFYYRSQKSKTGWRSFSAGHESHWATCPVTDRFRRRDVRIVDDIDHEIESRSLGERIAYLKAQAAEVNAKMTEPHLGEAKLVMVAALQDRVKLILRGLVK
jgi:hypothetical protein